MTVNKLQRQELFALLNPTEMALLSNASGVANVRKGERLYSEGSPASHFFVLLKGRVHLRRPTGSGPGLLVEDLGEGAVFGVSSLTGAERYLLNAECVEDAEVLKLEGRVLRSILEANALVGYTIQKRITDIFFRRYVEAMGKLESVMHSMLGPRAATWV
jgi:CRP/FNR family cyclic AMP-dependent transcriptional regulator